METQPRRPLVVVDIGYSHRKGSCGLAWTEQHTPAQVRFGQAIEGVAKQITVFKKCVLVLEAPLSTFHNQLGNPEIRGEFEKGRGWYWGPGAVALLAAGRFLEQLASKLGRSQRVFLAEAFLSNKSQRTMHVADAVSILDRFWDTKPEAMKSGVEPILDVIKGVPQVRVFDSSHQ